MTTLFTIAAISAVMLVTPAGAHGYRLTGVEPAAQEIKVGPTAGPAASKPSSIGQADSVRKSAVATSNRSAPRRN